MSKLITKEMERIQRARPVDLKAELARGGRPASLAIPTSQETGAANLGRGAAAWVVRSLRELIDRRRTAAALSGLDNHLLADIGIRREDIDVVAASVARRDRPRPAAGPLRWLADWQRRRRTVQELELLSDRILQDIGLTRADIRPFARSMVKH